MYFQVLQLRLIAILKGRVRNGELTERRLARLTGVSQPHIHNVLKGARILSPEIADQIMGTLRLSVFDLFRSDELSGIGRAGSALRYVEVPLLEGRLGPGYPIPIRESPIERYPFPHARLAAVEQPVAVRLGRDDAMQACFGQDDIALLDRSVQKRAHIVPDSLYVTAGGPGAALRYLRRVDGRLHAGTGFFDGAAIWESISSPGEDILEVVLAKVNWIGRDMERNGSAGEAAKKSGGADRSSDRQR